MTLRCRGPLSSEEKDRERGPFGRNSFREGSKLIQTLMKRFQKIGTNILVLKRFGTVLASG
jgi:hypothetical protein